MQSKVFSTNKTLNLGGTVLDLSVPKVMGVLNVTPDSFYEGSRYEGEEAILHQVEKMLTEGASLIDIGGYSTRPGADPVPAELERDRVIDAVRTTLRHFPHALVSVDTFRANVAREAVDAGATMVNDISGGSLDDAMFDTIASLRIPYVLMHMRGTPQTMNDLAHYDDLLKEIVDYLHPRIARLTQLGVPDVVVDPGFGFAKTVDQNFELLWGLDYMSILGRPVLVGISRKSMIWRTLGTDPEHALNGTTALHAIALLKGAAILRVHDVAPAIECIRLMTAMKKANLPPDKTKS